MNGERKLAMFIDFENIARGVKEAQYKQFELKLVLERLLEKGKIIVRRAYADWNRFTEYKRPFHEWAIELIDVPRHDADRYLGEGWPHRLTDAALWKRVAEIPNSELWAVHESLKERLVSYTRHRLAQIRVARGDEPERVVAAYELLDPRAQVRVLGHEPRLRLDLVEHAGDRLRGLHAPPVEDDRGHGRAGEAQRPEHAAVEPLRQVDARVLDPLALEHHLRRVRRVRGRDRV